MLRMPGALLNTLFHSYRSRETLIMRKARLAVGVASAVVATSTVLAPTPVEAGPALYVVQCHSASRVTPPAAVTRSNVMSCPAGILVLDNLESSSDSQRYDGTWCILTGNEHPTWSGWRIINSDCRGWVDNP